MIVTGNGHLFTREGKRSDSQKGGCESNQGIICPSEVVVRRIFKYVDIMVDILNNQYHRFAGRKLSIRCYKRCRWRLCLIYIGK